MLTLELLVVLLGALVAQFGPSVDKHGTHHTAAATWIGFGLVVFSYVLAIGGLGQARGGCMSWISQIATMAYSLYVGGVMPYLAAVFLVLWYFAIKILGPVLDHRSVRDDKP